MPRKFIGLAIMRPDNGAVAEYGANYQFYGMTDDGEIWMREGDTWYKVFGEGSLPASPQKENWTLDDLKNWLRVFVFSRELTYSRHNAAIAEDQLLRLANTIWNLRQVHHPEADRRL